MQKRYAAALWLILVAGFSLLYAEGTITPGSGWTGPTTEPAAIGNAGMRGYDCKAIARWDVVPHQTFTGTFNVGVVAFHLNGIDRVEFAVDGGSWTAVTEMTINPRTNVWEYWVTLDAADFADGPVDLRAIAYPKTAGEPRVLQNITGHELVLYTNSGGTLGSEKVYVSPANGNDATGDGTDSKPYQTFLKGLEHLLDAPGGLGGGTVYLDEGTYQYPNPSGDGCGGHWLTLTPWPGKARDKVIFSGSGSGVLQRWLHIKGIRIDHSKEDTAPFRLRSSPYGNNFWVEGCDMAGNGYAGDSLSTSGFVGGGIQYITESISHDHKVPVNATIVRNVDTWFLSGDLTNSRGLTINLTLDHMRPAPGVHPDIVQFYSGTTENCIIYGLKATDVVAQGINIGQAASLTNDVAIVNCLIEQVPADPQRSFIPCAQSGTANHILLWHHTYANINVVDDHGGQTNVDIRGCVFSAFSPPSSNISGWTRDINHFNNPSQVAGTNYTTGNPGWTRLGSWDGNRNQLIDGDYQPVAGSQLQGRISGLLVPIDVDGNKRTSPTTIGAVVGAGETGVENPKLKNANSKFKNFTVLPNPATRKAINDLQLTIDDLRLYSTIGDGINIGQRITPGVYYLRSGELTKKVLVVE